VGHAELRELKKFDADTIPNPIASPGLSDRLELIFLGLLHFTKLTIHGLKKEDISRFRGTITVDQ
jgi:hypothetical protein